MIRAIAFAILLLLTCVVSGCGSMISHEPAPSDWPRMEVRVHQVGFGTMLARCYKHLSLPMKLLGGFPAACAEIDFDRNVCDIWIGEGENDPGIMEHEQDHCEGKDHPHEPILRTAWVAYKAGK